MNLVWDSANKKILNETRGLCLEDAALLILERKYEAILENPNRAGQMIFKLVIEGYIHVVPFILDADENIVLKTIFPSRKFNALFGKDTKDET